MEAESRLRQAGLEKALFQIAYCLVLRWVAARALLLKQVEKGVVKISNLFIAQLQSSFPGTMKAA